MRETKIVDIIGLKYLELRVFISLRLDKNHSDVDRLGSSVNTHATQ